MGRTVTVELEQPDLATDVALDPTRTLLLLVDVQNQSFAPGGPSFHGAGDTAVLTSIHHLLAQARRKDLDVVWLRSVRTADQPIFSVFGMEPYRLEGTWSVGFPPPLAPRDGETVITKYTHDCFIDTPLEAHLRERRIVGPEWTVVVVGGSLANCVLEAVKGLSNRDYRVVVPLDCVKPNNGPASVVPLYQLGRNTYARTVTIAEDTSCLRFLARRRPPP